MSKTTQRKVTRVSTAHSQREGGGFIVRRPFPSRDLDRVDPFLMLDELGPVTYGPGEAIGAPAHPHRGFETVSYTIEGSLEHTDSAGHSGSLRAGDVQWMTAGAGVVHSEMPSRELLERGGRVHAFQLWVNLPAKDKMIAPRYQDVAAANIPRAKSVDGKAEVIVIAGEALGVRATIDTHTPIVYQHWILAPGASIDAVVPSEQRGFVYVFSGTAMVANRAVGNGQIAVLGDGDTINLANTSDAPAQLLLLAGTPLGETVVQYGPFVMNTDAEIHQAIRDYQTGKMGAIANH